MPADDAIRQDSERRTVGLLHVRDEEYFRAVGREIFGAHVNLELAEAPAERDLGALAQFLVAEQQDAVFDPEIAQGAERRFVEARGVCDTHLGAEARRQFAEIQ